MSYSIKAVLHSRVTENKTQKIIIQVIYNRMIERASTPLAIEKAMFKHGQIVNHKNAQTMNALLRKQLHDIEERLLKALRYGEIDKDALKRIVKGGEEITVVCSIEDYRMELTERIKNTISEGRWKHYKSSVLKFINWNRQLTFNDISVKILQQYSNDLMAYLDQNTVNANMKLLLSFFRYAVKDNLMKPEQFAGYKVPPYIQPMVEYLTEDETQRFLKVTESIQIPEQKRAGYYFLLSCFTGYRISDAKKFNAEEMIRGNNIILRATKNKNIVSIPIHPQLKKILPFIKENPLNLAEQNVRLHIKEIARLAGIRKYVKFHTARHTWAMLLKAKGFNLDEIAETLGDSRDVAKVYAQLSNEILAAKINKAFAISEKRAALRPLPKSKPQKAAV
jgi:site-specific recombinase XerD